MNIYHSDIRDYIAGNTKLLGLPLEGIVVAKLTLLDSKLLPSY